MTTPTDVSRAHAAAIAAMLQPLTQPPTSYQIFGDGKVKGTDSKLTYPYLYVWQTPGSPSILNLAGNLSDLTTTTQVTAVGRDRDEVMAAIGRVTELLHGYRPTIFGRFPGLVRQTPGDAYIAPDDNVQDPSGQATWQGVALFTLNSTAAPATP